MLSEDLSVFFDTDGHAVEATISTPQGVPVTTINIILSLPVGEVAVGQGEVAHLQPSLQAPTVELEGVKKNYVVEVGGSTYRVVRRENDGTGLSTVWMSKQ
jgi:hypothetical protein